MTARMRTIIDAFHENEEAWLHDEWRLQPGAERRFDVARALYIRHSHRSLRGRRSVQIPCAEVEISTD